MFHYPLHLRSLKLLSPFPSCCHLSIEKNNSKITMRVSAPASCFDFPLPSLKGIPRASTGVPLINFSLCFYLLSHKEARHNNLGKRLGLCNSCINMFFNLVLFIPFLLRLKTGKGQTVNPLHSTASFTQPEFIRTNSQAGAQLEVHSRSVKQTMAAHSETKQSWQEDSTGTINVFFFPIWWQKWTVLNGEGIDNFFGQYDPS